MNHKEGKVTEYNCNTGIIIDRDNNEYLIIKNNIKDDDNLTIGDDVIFIPEIFKTIEIEERIATFIQKIKKKED